MPASLFVILALAAQPAPDDGPVRTAPKEISDPVPGLDEAVVEPATATAPAPPARTIAVEQKTTVQGGTLQVVLGQRALFRLDDKGLPVLIAVEQGQLAAAHLEGVVTETFEPPPEGQMAVALDGSAGIRATILKVWNQTDTAVDYSAIALVMRQGRVTPTSAPVCAVPAHSVRTETWLRPVVAVGLRNFKPSDTIKACQQGD